MGVKMSAWVWAWVWAWVVLLATPTAALSTQRHHEATHEAPGMTHMLEALNRLTQALETHERHTSLYERVALLETSLAEKTENAMVLQAEVTQLRAKIPELEAEIETIPEMRKELGEFEAKIEKLVQDYEAKLSTLASEVIRLKKSGARRKDLLTLSDGSAVRLQPATSCPKVGQDMVAERIGEHCLYFSFGDKQNWTASHSHCQQLGAVMGAASQVLQPLKQFLRQAFARGPSLWLGSSFNLTDEGNHEEKYASEDEDVRSVVVNVSSNAPEQTFSVPLSQDSSNTSQADGVNGFPKGDAEEPPANHPPAKPNPPSNPLELNLKEIALEEAEEDVPGGAGSLRGVLNNVPMFQDDFLARYGSRFLADEPPADAPPAEEEHEKVSVDSVVDIVLLTGHDAAQEQQDTETRAPSNQTEARGLEAAVGALHEGVALPGEGESVEEAGGSGQEAGKAREARKTGGMKCMLLQQSESRDYEVVGRPCDEQHSFVCEIQVTIHSLLPEW